MTSRRFEASALSDKVRRSLKPVEQVRRDFEEVYEHFLAVNHADSDAKLGQALDSLVKTDTGVETFAEYSEQQEMVARLIRKSFSYSVLNRILAIPGIQVMTAGRRTSVREGEFAALLQPNDTGLSRAETIFIRLPGEPNFVVMTLGGVSGITLLNEAELDQLFKTEEDRNTSQFRELVSTDKITFIGNLRSYEISMLDMSNSQTRVLKATSLRKITSAISDAAEEMISLMQGENGQKGLYWLAKRFPQIHDYVNKAEEALTVSSRRLATSKRVAVVDEFEEDAVGYHDAEVQAGAALRSTVSRRRGAAAAVQFDDGDDDAVVAASTSSSSSSSTAAMTSMLASMAVSTPLPPSSRGQQQQQAEVDPFEFAPASTTTTVSAAAAATTTTTTTPSEDVFCLGSRARELDFMRGTATSSSTSRAPITMDDLWGTGSGPATTSTTPGATPGR